MIHALGTSHAGAFNAALSYVAATPEARHTIVAVDDAGVRQVAGLRFIPAPSLAMLRRIVAAEVRAAASPTIVHAHSSKAGAVVRLGLWGRSRPKSLVYTPHCFAFERRDIPFAARTLYFAAELLLATRTDQLAAVSPREATWARRLRHRSVVFLPNVATRGGGDPTHEPLVAPQPRHRFVACGRLSAQKDPDFFADVAALGSRACPEAEWVWIGDGDTKTRARLEGLGVVVTGWLNPQDASEYMRSATALVHTAAWEGAPLVFADARRVGVPIVARRTPSMAGIPLGQTYRTPADVVRALVSMTDPASRMAAIETQAGLDRLYDQRLQRMTLLGTYGIGHPVGLLPDEYLQTRTTLEDR